MAHMSTQQTYTTAQAAKSLGVTDSRVRQILLEARSIGRKHGTAWILTADDVYRIGLQLRKKTESPIA
jgi:hypothetical protein